MNLLKREIYKTQLNLHQKHSCYSSNAGDISAGGFTNREKFSQHLKCRFSSLVTKLQALFLLLFVLKVFSGKRPLCFIERDFPLSCLKCLKCLGNSEMNSFNQLLSIWKNPYLGFSESLRWISRILTVDFPNAYRWWSKSVFNFNFRKRP